MNRYDVLCESLNSMSDVSQLYDNVFWNTMVKHAIVYGFTTLGLSVFLLALLCASFRYSLDECVSNGGAVKLNVLVALCISAVLLVLTVVYCTNNVSSAILAIVHPEYWAINLVCGIN